MPLKIIVSFLTIVILINPVIGQENPEIKEIDGESVKTENSIDLPTNLYDTFKFSEEKAPYIRNSILIAGPSVMAIYGFATWGWNAGESFTFKPETHVGPYAVNGASDKYGHSWANFIGKRFFTFMFRACGSSRMRANIEGAILMEISSLGGEIGDGFSPHYGFDPYDFLFNQFGILFALLLDGSPLLDGIFTFKWEYYPSPQMKKVFHIIDHHDIATDYSGSKWVLTTKLGGIPYLSLTPLRYINVDVGYYTRGYRGAKYYSSRTRNIYVGLSLNYTFAFGDLLPVSYTSSFIQTFFNYYQPRWDLEVYEKVLSDRPHDEFDY